MCWFPPYKNMNQPSTSWTSLPLPTSSHCSSLSQGTGLSSLSHTRRFPYSRFPLAIWDSYLKLNPQPQNMLAKILNDMCRRWFIATLFVTEKEWKQMFISGWGSSGWINYGIATQWHIHVFRTLRKDWRHSLCWWWSHLQDILLSGKTKQGWKIVFILIVCYLLWKKEKTNICTFAYVFNRNNKKMKQN